MSYRNSTFAAFPDTFATGFASLPVNRIALDLSTGAFYRKTAVGTADSIAAAVTAGNCVKTTVTEVGTEIAAKADKAYVDNALAAKADVTAMNTVLAAKADKTYVDTALAAKAPSANPTFTGNVGLPATTTIGSISATELSYLDGATSNLQTQLNAKLSTTGVAADSNKWSGSSKAISVSSPSGGESGDVWLQYDA